MALRTAKEIYESNVQYERNDVSEQLKKSIIGAIRTAQYDAITKCAEVAELQSFYQPLPSDMKQSILDVINQLK